MKKKSSHLANIKQFLKLEEKNHQQLLGVSKQKLELPKIGVSCSQKISAKKTLIDAIKNIEEYMLTMQKPAPAIVSKCLVALKAQLQLYPATLAGQVRKTETSEPSDNKENQSIYKSQIFNVNKSRLQKVASKDLFEKVTTVKYSEGDVLNVSDREVIAVLKDKIKQKDMIIKKLHNHIDELQNDLTQLKAETKAAYIEKERLIIDNLNLSQELQKEKQKDTSQDQTLKKLNLQIVELRDDKKSTAERCKVLKNELSQKEAQLLSLWQLSLQLKA